MLAQDDGLSLASPPASAPTQNAMQPVNEEDTSEERSKKQMHAAQGEEGMQKDTSEDQRKKMREADEKLVKQAQNEADNRMKEHAKSQASAFFEGPFVCVGGCLRSMVPCVKDTFENCFVCIVGLPAIIAYGIAMCFKFLGETVHNFLKRDAAVVIFQLLHLAACIFLCVAYGKDQGSENPLRKWAVIVIAWYFASHFSVACLAYCMDDTKENSILGKIFTLFCLAFPAFEALLVFVAGIYWAIKYADISMWVPLAAQWFIAVTLSVWLHSLVYQVPKLLKFWNAEHKDANTALIVVSVKVLLFGSWIAVAVECSDTAQYADAMAGCNFPLWTWAYVVSISYPIGAIYNIIFEWASFLTGGDEDFAYFDFYGFRQLAPAGSAAAKKEENCNCCRAILYGVYYAIHIFQFTWNVVLGFFWAHQDHDCGLEMGENGASKSFQELNLVAKWHAGILVCLWLLPLVVRFNETGTLGTLITFARNGSAFCAMGWGGFAAGTVLVGAICVFGAIVIGTSGIVLAAFLCLGIAASCLWCLVYACMKSDDLNNRFGASLRRPINSFLSTLYTRGVLLSPDGISHREYDKYIDGDLKEEERTCMVEWCAVCMGSLRNNVGGKVPAKVKACGHYFHKDCLQYWCRKAHKCPLCRTDMRRDTQSADRRSRA